MYPRDCARIRNRFQHGHRTCSTFCVIWSENSLYFSQIFWKLLLSSTNFCIAACKEIHIYAESMLWNTRCVLFNFLILHPINSSKKQTLVTLMYYWICSSYNKGRCFKQYSIVWSTLFYFLIWFIPYFILTCNVSSNCIVVRLGIVIFIYFQQSVSR